MPELGVFALKHWTWLAIAGLVITLAITNGRLSHAKADQWDRTACVKGPPCTPVKWKAEVAELRPALAAKSRDLGTCHASEANLQAGVDRQNAAIAALAAQGAARTAASAAAMRSVAAASQGLQRAAATVLAAKPGPDACQSADELILRGLQP